MHSHFNLFLLSLPLCFLYRPQCHLSICPSIHPHFLSITPPPTTCCTPTCSFASVAECPRRALCINFRNEVEKHFWAIINATCRHGNSCRETLPWEKQANEGGSATTGRVTDSPSDGAINLLTSACVSLLHLQRTVCCQTVVQPSAGKCIIQLNCWKTLSQPRCHSDLDKHANLPQSVMNTAVKL